MQSNEIINRLTGLSSPIFGISWNPPKSEVSIAKKVITQLEDRRVLYNPSVMEMPEHCVISVLDIHKILTEELGQLSKETKLSESIRAMRNACRKFLDTVGHDEKIVRFGRSFGHYANWRFNSAIGELRGTIGIHIA